MHTLPLVFLLCSSALRAAPPSPTPDRSTSRFGLGVLAGSTPQPASLGLDISGTAPSGHLRVGMRFEHRSYRGPYGDLEATAVAQGASEGVQGYWAGRLRFASFARVTAARGNPRPGVDLGISMVRELFINEKVQEYLMEQDNLAIVPRWTFLAGPELHLGVFGVCDWFHATALLRYHHPLYTRLDSTGLGYLAEGTMWDPVQTVSPEMESGVGFMASRGLWYGEIEIYDRLTFPSAMARGLNQETGTVLDLLVDVSLGIGF